MQRRSYSVPKCDRVAQSRDRELCGHPGVNRIADDPVGVNVFDRAQIQLAFVGTVLSDIHEP